MIRDPRPGPRARASLEMAARNLPAPAALTLPLPVFRLSVSGLLAPDPLLQARPHGWLAIACVDADHQFVRVDGAAVLLSSAGSVLRQILDILDEYAERAEAYTPAVLELPGHVRALWLRRRGEDVVRPLQPTDLAAADFQDWKGLIRARVAHTDPRC